MGGDAERHRRRQGQQQRQLEPAILRLDRAPPRRRAHAAATAAAGSRCDGEADDAQRQLFQPVGVIKVRDRGPWAAARRPPVEITRF